MRLSLKKECYEEKKDHLKTFQIDDKIMKKINNLNIISILIRLLLSKSFENIQKRYFFVLLF